MRGFATQSDPLQWQRTHRENISPRDSRGWRTQMLPTAVRTAMAVLALLAWLPSTAHAQASSFTPSPNNRGNIMLSSSFDATNAYLFRCLRQDDTRLIMWPSADAG